MLARPTDEHPVIQHIKTIAELERNALDKRTGIDRVPAAVTRVAGSTTFIMFHAGWFTL